MDILIFKSGIAAFLITIISTPIVIYISNKKGLLASVNHRSSHKVSIPNTGGIVLCIAILTALILFSNYPSQEDFSLLISALAVLLITGIIDDFNPIPVAYKFLGQFIPAIVIVSMISKQDLTIPFIHSIVELPGVFNYLFWILFIVIAINAFNLIDGIDGLAIGMGIVGSIFYLIKFIGLSEANLSIFAISLSTGLFGLLFFNISSKLKIFLGDTGSLMIGGLLVFFALNFISLSESTINSSFFLVLGSFFIPMADLIRVTLIRLYIGKSPFTADNKHIHHIILDLISGNHLFTTIILILCQIGIVAIFQLMDDADSIMHLIIIVVTFFLYSGIALVLERKRNHLAD